MGHNNGKKVSDPSRGGPVGSFFNNGLSYIKV